MNQEFSSLTRVRHLQRLSEATDLDLLIIGGGITGAGVARDAASRGMKVGLIEANDFASGTSSRSSKLIHGGVRYLENLEFGLVFEALSERRLLFEIAPHLVHPLRFVLPLYEGQRVGMFKMGLGMWLYDILAMFEAPRMHERLSRHQCLSRLPMLKSEGLKGAFAYSDAYMDDDRLVIETLRSAHGFGAISANFVKATGALFENQRVIGVRCQDQISKTEFNIKAKHVVSTVGPWTDQLGHLLFDDWKDQLRPSKGIHLTFLRSRMRMKEAVVMAADKDSRIVFGIPRHEMIIVGTTDTDYSGDPGQVRSEKEDVDYLLKVVGEYFPGSKLTHEDIVASYSGVRPLVDDGSQTESKTSREHVIISDPRNVTFVSGGKYTTYRNMAEETVNSVLAGFPIESRVKFNLTQTRRALNDLVTPDSLKDAFLEVEEKAKFYAQAGIKDTKESLEFFVERHGPEAWLILDQALNAGLKDRWSIEAMHAIRSTMCLNLVDFYLRRSPLFLSLPDHGFSIIDALAEVFAKHLGWTHEERRRQIQMTQDHLKTEMAWR